MYLVSFVLVLLFLVSVFFSITLHSAHDSFLMKYLSDFLGFDKAPDTSVEKYREEIRMGLYPPEIHPKEKTDEESSAVLVLPWTYCPTPDDPVACLHLVEELMHLIIILITVRWIHNFSRSALQVDIFRPNSVFLHPLGNAVTDSKQ